MRVLTITNMWPSAEKPWYGIFVARQMRSLSLVDVEVDVLPIYGQGSPWRSLAAYAKAAGRVIALNFRPRRYDLIHAHTGHCALIALLQLRHPVVVSYVGYDIDLPAEQREGWWTKLERRIFVQLSRLVAGIIVKSRPARDHLPHAVLGRTQLIPNGVDREAFSPMDRGEARGRVGWDHDDPVALFANDPDRYNKRFWLAEEAVSLARANHPTLRLEVCHGIDPKLIPAYMSAADLLLLSSLGEDSPNVVKEAMACDLPVVAVDIGDVPDVVTGARHCHVCPPEAEALASGISEVVEALPERSDGRARSEHLGLPAIAARVRALYDAALAQGPGLLGFRSRTTSQHL